MPTSPQTPDELLETALGVHDLAVALARTTTDGTPSDAAAVAALIVAATEQTAAA